MPGILEPLVFEYSNPGFQNKKDRSGFVFQNLMDILQRNNDLQGVAVIFSANENQAQELYRYNTGEKISTPAIQGSNQAEVFGHLAERIANSAHGNKIHILPVSTMEKNHPDRPIPLSCLIRDLSNIQSYLNQNWHVVVLTNSNQMCMEKDVTVRQIFQIGGGRAKNFYVQDNDKHRNAPFLNKLLSQGHFVERVLLDFFKLYKSYQSNAFVQNENLPKKLRDILSHEYTVLNVN